MSTSNPTGDLILTDANDSCACCAPGQAGKAEAGDARGTLSADFMVTGMTCGHCVASVTEELSSLDGVDGVEVELNAGGASRVTVASASPIDVHQVREAVAEAGYELVEPTR
jgi:copper chaperone CopZ